MDIKKKIDNAPDLAGVYLFKDTKGHIIYIGKAVSIRKRLKGHFAKYASGKEKALIDSTDDIDYMLTPDESTALLLEAALIRRYLPKYNVALRDDKSYPRLKLTVNEEYPRLFITRRLKDDGALYFGPYTNAKLLRKAVDFMRRVFALRTCKNISQKACLNFHMGQCIAPCIDPGKKDEYKKILQELILFLEGKRDELSDNLTRRMEDASESKDYELAAKVRDRIKALSLLTPGPGQQKTRPEALVENPRLDPVNQLEELRSILNLAKTPSIIEAFDVSNTYGKEAVGSMVCFKDARPDKNQYRRFQIKTVNLIDDYSMMREIVSRRYRYLLETGQRLPDLVIIDGGKGHLLAAKKEMQALELWQVPVISIAKGLDKIYVSRDREPIILGKFEAALYLVQRMRDEAHRFAISYHRLLRSRKTSASDLDGIEGIGPKRKTALIRHFGSLQRISAAAVDDLKGVETINEKEAKAIYNYFHK